MRFEKMQGIGNDYVYVDCTKGLPENPGEIAIKVSDRHFGIGSDGLILICASDKADFRMEMYNADGSRGKMCGNGIRCVGKFVYDHELTDKTDLDIETDAGIKKLKLTVSDGKVTEVRVDMGRPIFTPAQIPVAGNGQVMAKDKLLDMPFGVGGIDYTVSCVSMGNPHCVVFTNENVDRMNLPEIGKEFEFHPFFPERVNTEFVNVIDRHTLKMRVWERGSGETLACGTGACGVAATAILTGRAESPVTVRLLGGDLTLEWDSRNSLYMTGPATSVFTGEIDL